MTLGEALRREYPVSRLRENDNPIREILRMCQCSDKLQKS